VSTFLNYLKTTSFIENCFLHVQVYSLVFIALTTGKQCSLLTVVYLTSV